MTTHTPPQQPTPDTPTALPPAAPPHRSMVLLAILVTLLLAGAVLGLLIYRGLTQPEPTRKLVVRADSRWDGVELSVEGGNLKEPRVTAFEKLGNYTIPFFLWPGQYTLHVKSQGVEVYTKSFDLTHATAPVELDLLRTGATTRPATNPASQVAP